MNEHKNLAELKCAVEYHVKNCSNYGLLRGAIMRWLDALAVQPGPEERRDELEEADSAHRYTIRELIKANEQMSARLAQVREAVEHMPLADTKELRAALAADAGPAVTP